jgi:hypothetical protein
VAGVSLGRRLIRTPMLPMVTCGRPSITSRCCRIFGPAVEVEVSHHSASMAGHAADGDMPGVRRCQRISRGKENELAAIDRLTDELSTQFSTPRIHSHYLDTVLGDVTAAVGRIRHRCRPSRLRSCRGFLTVLVRRRPPSAKSRTPSTVGTSGRGGLCTEPYRLDAWPPYPTAKKNPSDLLANAAIWIFAAAIFSGRVGGV